MSGHCFPHAFFKLIKTRATEKDTFGFDQRAILTHLPRDVFNHFIAPADPRGKVLPAKTVLICRENKLRELFGAVTLQQYFQSAAHLVELARPMFWRKRINDCSATDSLLGR